jgi:UDP-N-acetylglucosamine pyrophosphorylase
MKLNLLATSLLSIALAGFVSAQGTEVSSDKALLCPHSHLKQMTREAHTQEQYKAIAECYEKLQKYYLQKAAEERQEWARISQNITASAAKYPRPVDSARNRYEYYLSQASKAGELSAKYSQLTAQETSYKEQ